MDISSPSRPPDSLWPLILGLAHASTVPAVLESSTLHPAVMRLARLASPSLADYLLAPFPALRAMDELSIENVEKARLRHRLQRARNLEWVGRIRAAGFKVLALKGMASAHDLYPHGDLRGMGDMDLLVARRELAPLVSFLKREGFSFHAPALPPWGFIAEASFFPFLSADGLTNIDLHVQGDEYPVFLSLPAEDIFAASREVKAGGVSFDIPSRTHLLLLAMTNSARDKFLSFSFRTLLDGMRLLCLHGDDVDWNEIALLAQRGGFEKPVACFLALAQYLGVPENRLSAALMPSYGLLQRPVFSLLAQDVADFFLYPVTKTEQALREMFLTAQPKVLWQKYARRLKGLVRPYPGIPEGI